MKIVHRLLLVLLISVFLFGCSGKKGSTTEGKLVDGQGQPLSGISVTFKQVRPVAGYEQLEAKTGIDGIFRVSGLMPDSEYIITPVSDKWTTKVTMKITAGKEGQPLVLSSPIVIRFTMLPNGTIIDTKTGLQWLIYTATDINAGNVLNTVKNIREGGFNDWRLPTKAELLGLQDKQPLPQNNRNPRLLMKPAAFGQPSAIQKKLNGNSILMMVMTFGLPVKCRQTIGSLSSGITAEPPQRPRLQPWQCHLLLLSLHRKRQLPLRLQLLPHRLYQKRRTQLVQRKPAIL